ncbi:hypothetical protein WR25_17925 isoform D [Diploscapter pachys]|uniref:Bromo domain-containing protein n=1 Tax=Diploscapter pachys TaxID=2018661 RepID=A0A2A2KEI5_9BILA|nr:hypothetical protein WR25_17925 isoform A [Diploscapter pachys]PAV72320.1 hypothetical protein WR25_17925 isoform B [Diploscapter pachys]PAV72321.1 hypothetical protein WR25_17925 isoform C [Diploscapter pachys]PAV72322.1 hypothetical protein WR25_17925 isoform D [Diploscapter pachys]
MKVHLKWTAQMQYALMQGYQTFDDWDSRAKAVNEWMDDSRKAVVTTKDCKQELERLMNLPCPKPVDPISIESGSYSRKAVIESWVQHLKHEADKEIDVEHELQLVQIRQKADLLEKVDAGKLTPEELDELLEQLRKEDEEAPDVEQRYIVINAYAARFRELEQMKKDGTKSKSSSRKAGGGGKSERLSATRRGLQSPVGAKNLFRSPSPNSRSPIKSPIRPVAEALRDAHSSSIEQQQQVAVKKLPISGEKQRVRELKEELDSHQERHENVVEVEKKKPAQKNIHHKMNEEMSLNEKALETPSVKKRKLEEPSTSGGKKKSESASKKRDNADAVSVAASESSRHSDSSSVVAKSGSVSVSAKEPLLVKQPHQTVEIMTDISIRHQLNVMVRQEKKQPRRQSKRPTESEDKGPHKSTQTGRVDFEREDVVFVNCVQSGKVYQKPIKVEDSRTKVEDWSDEDELSLEKLARKSASTNSPSQDALPSERDTSSAFGGKEANFDVMLVYEVDQWVAEEYSKRPGYEMVRIEADLQHTPVKRRKEEKGTRGIGTEKEEIKRALLSAWNIISTGPNAHIFATPVTDDVEEGYSKVVKRRMDLATIKKEIESGAIMNWLELKHKLMQMFANAVMYNSTEHFVNNTSKKLAEESIENARLMFVETLKNKTSVGHGRRSKMLGMKKIVSTGPNQPMKISSFPPRGTKRQILWKKSTEDRQRHNV